MINALRTVLSYFASHLFLAVIAAIAGRRGTRFVACHVDRSPGTLLCDQPLSPLIGQHGGNGRPARTGRESQPRAPGRHASHSSSSAAVVDRHQHWQDPGAQSAPTSRTSEPIPAAIRPPPVAHRSPATTPTPGDEQRRERPGPPETQEAAWAPAVDNFARNFTYTTGGAKKWRQRLIGNPIGSPSSPQRSPSSWPPSTSATCPEGHYDSREIVTSPVSTTSRVKVDLPRRLGDGPLPHHRRDRMADLRLRQVGELGTVPCCTWPASNNAGTSLARRDTPTIRRSSGYPTPTGSMGTCPQTALKRIPLRCGSKNGVAAIERRATCSG